MHRFPHAIRILTDEQLKKEKLNGTIGNEQNKKDLPRAIRTSVHIKETELIIFFPQLEQRRRSQKIRVKAMHMQGEGIYADYASHNYPELSCLRINGLYRDPTRFYGIENLFCDQTRPGANVIVRRKDAERFLLELGTQEWDSNVRPGGNFEDVPYMIDIPHSNGPNTEECLDFQQTDGEWASLSILIKKSANPENPSLRVFLRCRNTTGGPPQQMDVSLNFQFWGHSFLRKSLDLDVRFAGKESVEAHGGKLCRWRDLKLTREEYEETQVFPRIPDEQLKKMKLYGAIGKKQNKNKLPHAIRVSVRIKETELLSEDFLKAVDLAKEHQFGVGSRTFFAHKTLLKNVRHARNEKKLKESVDPLDFQNLLRVSSLSANIDDSNVEGLLVVSSILNVKDVHEKCKRFIKDGSRKSLKKKFQLVLQYRWEALKSQVILQFGSAEQMYNSIPSYLQTTQASVEKLN